MPDKWAQYAQPVQGPQQSADKWEQYAEKKAAAPVGGDLRPLTDNERFEMNYPVGVKGEGFGENVKNFANNVGVGIYKTIAHPIDTAAGIAKSLIPGTDTPNPIQSMYQGLNTRPAETIAPMIGSTIATAGLGKIVKPIAAPVGEAMQTGAKGIIKRTLGATERNFQRGKDPVQAYFDEGIGPSMSMGSIAQKSGAAKEAVGKSIGTAVDNATAAGTRIPSGDFAPRIMGPINETRSILQGPGGGSTEGVDALEGTFRPTLAKPDVTPRELLDVKRNVGKNTSFTAANDVGLKQTRQRITGGLSEPLEKHVPELQDLNPRYANANELASLATKRANSGVPLLSQATRKVGEAAAGGLIGYATHNPALGMLPIIADTVPARTAAASGLYHAGRVMPTAAESSRFLGPLVVPPVGDGLKNKKPKEEADEK